MPLVYKIQTEFLKAIETKNSWGKNEITDLYIRTVNKCLMDELETMKIEKGNLEEVLNGK